MIRFYLSSEAVSAILQQAADYSLWFNVLDHGIHEDHGQRLSREEIPPLRKVVSLFLLPANRRSKWLRPSGCSVHFPASASLYYKLNPGQCKIPHILAQTRDGHRFPPLITPCYTSSCSQQHWKKRFPDQTIYRPIYIQARQRAPRTTYGNII